MQIDVAPDGRWNIHSMAEPLDAEPLEAEPPVPELNAPVPELLLLPPAPGPATSAAPATPPEPVTFAPQVEADILDYWDGLRGPHDFPALDALDRGHVAARWPNTVLVAVGETELPRITRLGENDGDIEYTATVIDWIMARSRNAAKRGEPMEEERRFAVSSGGARYHLLLLPLGGGSKADHVLCQLSRLEELSAVASFRRWLTG